mmetsp:Transcript_3679/g.7262  ORF Transcript_3679/g.7262 Transcript_3679/m.7262 type:complete len:216 (-) Transcript_3679:787-1434(-)
MLVPEKTAKSGSCQQRQQYWAQGNPSMQPHRSSLHCSEIAWIQLRQQCNPECAMQSHTACDWCTVDHTANWKGPDGMSCLVCHVDGLVTVPDHAAWLCQGRDKPGHVLSSVHDAIHGADATLVAAVEHHVAGLGHTVCRIRVVCQQHSWEHWRSATLASALHLLWLHHAPHNGACGLCVDTIGPIKVQSVRCQTSWHRNAWIDLTFVDSVNLHAA